MPFTSCDTSVTTMLASVTIDAGAGLPFLTHYLPPSSLPTYETTNRFAGSRLVLYSTQGIHSCEAPPPPTPQPQPSRTVPSRNAPSLSVALDETNAPIAASERCSLLQSGGRTKFIRSLQATHLQEISEKLCARFTPSILQDADAHHSPGLRAEDAKGTSVQQCFFCDRSRIPLLRPKKHLSCWYFLDCFLLTDPFFCLVQLGLLPPCASLAQDMAFEKQRQELIAMQKTGSDLRVASLGEARVNNNRRRKQAGTFDIQMRE